MQISLAMELPGRTRRRRTISPAISAKSPIGPHLLSGIPVVLVEDDRLSAKLMGLLLGMEGAVVNIAHSAEEALPLIEILRPPLVVLDLVLPRMSGLLLLDQVKRQPWAVDTTFVAVSSFNGPETKRAVFEAGCAGYLRKPIDTETFAGTVASYMPGRRS